MPDDSKESKAKKIAAARKKLKEYQAKEKRDSDVAPPDLGSHHESGSSAASLVVSESHSTDSLPMPADNTVSDENSIESTPKPEHDEAPLVSHASPRANSSNNLETIQILITEKFALTSELNQFRSICREKELENEELSTQFQLTSKRLDDLQKEFLAQQKQMEEIKSNNLTLQVQMESLRSKNDDQTEHLDETKKLLSMEKERNQSLRNELKDTANELELAKIRINQLSDEASITKDNRVESLTQTQFMYEQQIRDLQAMVQQLTRDKEQANQQYQTYVQHLNAEVTNLTEKNNELTEECTKLQEREGQFVDHISGLEKEIQKSISRQDQFKEQHEIEVNGNYVKEIEDLKEKISKFEAERYEFQLKIKSQEDHLDNLNKSLTEKDTKITELEEHLQNLLSERPDSGKLLATMESDKIAASRALIQNEGLKKQLEEMELRFVQLTNDKADLVNKLDAEEYANREIRNNFSTMEDQLNKLDEKLHFKDEEMIRLSHENNELEKQNLVLQQQLDRFQHYEAREYANKLDLETENPPENDHETGYHSHDDHNHHDHSHDEHDHSGHNHADNDDDHNNSQHSESSSGHAGHNHSHSPTSSDHLLKEHSPEPVSPEHQHHHRHSHTNPTGYRYDEPPTIPTIEALHKLQNRFTKLMSQVADLTDEKQRLEHLVLQLQGETETIGEYITLYQTQRRILKQREYEKAAQLQILVAEREEMREKITTLNKLVSNLGVELPNNLRLSETINSQMENICIEPSVGHATGADSEQQAAASHQAILDEAAMNKRLNSNESKEILAKIQNIITEIKENTKEIPPVNTADHLMCCSGKFEIV